MTPPVKAKWKKHFSLGVAKVRNESDLHRGITRRAELNLQGNRTSISDFRTTVSRIPAYRPDSTRRHRCRDALN